MEQPFHPSDLPLVDGRVYHLRLSPQEVAEDILIVGDPGRVDLIEGEFLREVEVRRDNRGLKTVTGYTDWGQRVTVTTSGMGTPSLEIVLNELVALHEIDFETMRRKERPPRVNVIRVGTSGGLQRDVELGTLVITEYAVGLDNTGMFYEAPLPDENSGILEERVREVLESAVDPKSRFRGRIFPYVSKAHPDVVRALESACSEVGVEFRRGVTVSNSGFFANQGRSVSRIPPVFPDIDVLLGETSTGIRGLRFENMEMEASFLLHFMYPLGHRAGVVCPVIDKRPEEKFLKDYRDRILLAARAALFALRRLREWR
jgi:uridine phosphorylase